MTTHDSDFLHRLLDYTGVAGVMASPSGDELAMVTNESGDYQISRRPIATDADTTSMPCGTGAVASVLWRPDGRALLATVEPDGEENFRLIEFDATTGRINWQFDEADVRHEIGTPYGSGNQPYSPDSTQLAYSSNARDRESFDVLVRDLASGRSRTVFVGDDRYYPMFWSPDATKLLLVKLHQNSEHSLIVCDLENLTHRTITPDGVAKWLPGGWSADGYGIYVATDHGRDLLGAAYLDIETGTLDWLATPDHEITGVTVDPTGTRLAWGLNTDGYTHLHVDDLQSRERTSVTCLPNGTSWREFGMVGQHPRFVDDRRLLTVLSTPTAPAEAYLVDTMSDTSARLTNFAKRVPQSKLSAPEVIRFPGTDGRSIPALLWKPPGLVPGQQVPVAFDLHGGPEWQHVPAYDPLVHGLLEAGIGVLAPNPRGSSGYGNAYQREIYGDWVGGDIDEIECAVNHLRDLDWVDSQRLAVYGGSYGGLATLACLVRMPEVWRTGISFCGPSDLINDIMSVPPYWRRRMPEWLGDLNDPAVEAMLRRRSPLEHADRIRAPVLVIQGTRDVRVPREHADKLVQRLRELELPVEYIILDEVGHGTGDQDTNARITRRILEWLVSHLAAD